MTTQKHKTLVTKNGEWAAYLSDGQIGISEIPRILAKEATIEGLRDYMINVEGIPQELAYETLNKLEIIEVEISYAKTWLN